MDFRKLKENISIITLKWSICKRFCQIICSSWQIETTRWSEFPWFLPSLHIPHAVLVFLSCISSKPDICGSWWSHFVVETCRFALVNLVFYTVKLSCSLKKNHEVSALNYTATNHTITHVMCIHPRTSIVRLLLEVHPLKRSRRMKTEGSRCRYRQKFLFFSCCEGNITGSSSPVNMTQAAQSPSKLCLVFHLVTMVDPIFVSVFVFVIEPYTELCPNKCTQLSFVDRSKFLVFHLKWWNHPCVGF